jgi:hypothetical protein
MIRWMFALSILVGAGLIVAQPHWLLPASFGLIDCWGISEASVMENAVGGAAIVCTMILIPAALASSLWRRLACLREFGTTSVTRGQATTVMRTHIGLRVLANAASLLALVAGGLIVQLGYMAAL